MKSLNQKSVQMGIQTISWFIILCVWAAGLFSPEGHGIIVAEAPWLGKAAEAASNIVGFITIAFALLLILSFIALLGDDYIPESSEKMVKVYGPEQTLKKLGHKKLRFFFVSMPTWFLMMSVAWYWTATIWILLYVVLLSTSAKQSEYIEGKYINATGDNHEETTSDSTA